MNIILDGPDGVGKTTLVNKLKEHYNIDSIRMSYKDPKDFNFYSRLLEKTDCIFDRQFLSELVYAPLFERECQLTIKDVNELFTKIQELQIPIFILDADKDVIIERLLNRGGEHATILKSISYLKEQFKILATVYNIEIIDTSKMTFEDILRKVEMKYEKHKGS